MTDDEIIQYLETIKPIYTQKMKENLMAIKYELEGISNEQGQLNLLEFDQPPVEVVDQVTSDKERKRQETIIHHKNELTKETDILKNTRYLASFSAKKLGIRGELKKLREMPRCKISDFQEQAEILNILDNKYCQIQQACELIEKVGVLNEHTLSYGETAVLKGSWDEAIDAVCLTTKEGNKIYGVEFEGELLDEDITQDHDTDHQVDNNSFDSSNDERLTAFDPVPLSGIAKMFPLKKDEQHNLFKWKSYAEMASRNNLNNARTLTGRGKAKSKFDPYLVGEWLINKGLYPRDKIERKLANNLPLRSSHLKDLFLP